MNLFVAKLNSGSTSEDLQKLFAHYGVVSSARVIFDKETGNSKRYGFVEMPIDLEAKEALRELNDTEFQESTIVVKESLQRENQSGIRNQQDLSQKRGNYPNHGAGQRDFNRDYPTQRNYNRGNDNRGSYGQRSYENRY